MHDQAPESPLLIVRNVAKTYQGPAPISILKKIDFALHRGETLAIVGQSGSGKSTLLSLLAGLDRPSQGDITLLGKDLTRMPSQRLTHYRAQHIGIIFQQFHLLEHLSAVENVILPLRIRAHALAPADTPAKVYARATEALRQVGLEHRLHHRPAQLSGGERQRVAMARAWVLAPPLLLADEPTGSLDTVTAEAVSELLFTLAHQHQSGLILVTHDTKLAQRCQRILCLSQGQLVTEG